MWKRKARLGKDISKWGRRIAIIFIAFGLLVSSREPALPISYQGKDTGIILSAMPIQDRRNLEFFFRKLLEDGPFGYVLLGKKPAAFEGIFLNFNPFFYLWTEERREKNPSINYQPTLFQKFRFYLGEAISYNRFKSIQSYRTWRKYEKFFLLERFAFIYHNSSCFGSNDLTIMLVNKKKFVETVDRHYCDFKEILKQEINGKDFLNELIQSQNLDLILTHNGLLGTLLGYGRDNAFLFHARSHIKTAHEAKLFCKKNQFKSVWGKENIHLSLVSTNGLRSIYLPSFVADITSLETKVLRKEYLAQRAKIIDYYEGKDFLEATLRLLTSTEKL